MTRRAGSGVPRGPLVDAFTSMLRIRRFEERVRQLRVEGAIVGSVHLCIGQEAIYVGARSALEAEDLVFATYRGHGWAISSGVPLHQLFGELMGRSNGVNSGRGGSAYFVAPDWGFYGENSIVGGGAPVGVGAALGFAFRDLPRVSLVAIGDGAMNQGAVHEALNFAAVFNLPVVFIVENNEYSELTATREMIPIEHLSERAPAYGMPGFRVDGNDVEEVYRIVGEAAAHARERRGPSLVVCDTQRLVGHYIGDVEQYRPAGEVEQAALQEPLVLIQDRLKAAGVDQDAIDLINHEVEGEVDSAAQLALSSHPSDPHNVLDHLYA